MVTLRSNKGSRKRSEKQTGRMPHGAAADVREKDSVQGTRPPLQPEKKAFSYYLEGLLAKRATERKEALAVVTEGLTSRSLGQDLVEEKFATFLYRGLNSLQKVSSISTVETQLSLKLIALLAVIVDCEDDLSELYREVLPQLYKCMESGKSASTTMTKALDCLAVVGFFGANNSEEVESAMQIVWEFINNPEKNSSGEVLVAGIYAGLFLLTSMEGWKLNQNNWNGAITCFSRLLEHEDRRVGVAASEALALIFETDSLDKFWSEGKDGSVMNYLHTQQVLREMILKKLKCLYMDIGERSAAKTVGRVVKYFGSLRFPGSSITVCGKNLNLSSWYQMIQLQFLKGFLADGFDKHMRENDKLQSLFEFNPRRNECSGPVLYVSTSDEVHFTKRKKKTSHKISVCFFLAEQRDPENLMAEDRKKERVWRNSLYVKARTQLISKHRLLSKELRGSDFESLTM